MRHNKFSSLVLIVLLSFHIFGCQRYHGFNYNVAENDTDFGSVRAKLQGSKSDWVFFAKHDSPYDLWIKFKFDALETADIIIDELKLIDSKSSKSLLKIRDLNSKYSLKDHSGGNHSYIRVEKVPIEYKDYTVHLIFRVISNGIASEYAQTLYLKMNYEAFWQTLLSV